MASSEHSAWVQRTYGASGSGGQQPASRSRLVVGVAAVVGIMVLLLAGSAWQLGYFPAASSQPADPARMSANDIFALSGAQMTNAGTYHASETVGKRTTEILAAGRREVEFKTTDPSGVVDILAAGGNRYLKAPGSFYKDTNPVLAENAGDKWIYLGKQPIDGVLAAVLDTGKMSQCILGRHGTLTKKGLVALAGVNVIEVDDGGEIPGGTPAKYFFAPTGNADLVQIQVTAPTTPGGKDPDCAGGLGIFTKTAEDAGIYSFSKWGRSVELSNPGSAIDLAEFPYCDTPLDPKLNAAAKQYLLVRFHLNQRLKAISDSCGCESGNWFLMRQSVLDEIAALEEYVRGLRALPADAAQRKFVDATIQVEQTRIDLFRVAVATNSMAGYTGFRQRIADAAHQEATAIPQMREALGLPARSNARNCDFLIP